MQSVLTRTDSHTKPLSELRMGKYVLLRQLGQGGSATIYLGICPQLEQKVGIESMSYIHRRNFRAQHRGSALFPLPPSERGVSVSEHLALQCLSSVNR